MENDSANTSILQNSAVWEERESLEAREKLFQEQKANFEQERKSFNEEALRLAREVIARNYVKKKNEFHGIEIIGC